MIETNKKNILPPDGLFVFFRVKEDDENYDPDIYRYIGKSAAGGCERI